MKEKWIVINRKNEFVKLNSEIEMHPLITRILVNRGISSKDKANLFVNGTVKQLRDSSIMKDMKKGVALIKEAIINKRKIVIYGDYDCDGVSSTAILYRTLKALGANFTYYIPNREDEGYGMNTNRIRILKEEGAEYILTCDNGISATEEINYAKELGLKVIITDHHDIPFIIEDDKKVYKIPNADCVIDPKQIDCPYEFKDLCGAGIALKFAMEIFKEMSYKTDIINELFQYAAIATVCDVVELLDENRIIVKEGLRNINRKPNLGILELLKVNNLKDKNIEEYHFGFVLGPCINATGRLETADLSVNLLIEEDANKAKELAKSLFELNAQRQELTLESLERIKKNISVDTNKEKVILVYDKEVHESIAGIVAGRIREKYNLPTIILTEGKDMPKGSGRSIDGYNMYDELNKHKDLIYKFGGHTMAAGLSVKEDNIKSLREALIKDCPLTDDDILKVIKIDSPLSIESINEEIVSEINNLKPYGKGNPSPLFAAREVNVSRIFFMGREKNIMKFRFSMNNNTFIEAINFDKFQEFKEEYIHLFGEDKFLDIYNTSYSNFSMDIVYYPTINEFNGKKSIQLNLKNFRFSMK